MKTKILSLVAVALLASGCSYFNGTSQNQTGVNVAKLAVTYGVVKYCEKAGDPAAQAARCARVKTVATGISNLASGDTAVSIALLDAAIQAQLPANMTPTDRALVVALIQTIEAELAQRVGSDLLKPDQVLVVKQVIGWVIDATSFIPPAP